MNAENRAKGSGGRQVVEYGLQGSARRFRKRYLVIFLAIAIALGIKYCPVRIADLRYAHAQHQCCTFDAQDQLVYAVGRPADSTPPSDGKFQIDVRPGIDFGLIPKCWNEFWSCYDPHRRPLFEETIPTGIAVYLHERTRPSGEAVLVYIGVQRKARDKVELDCQFISKKTLLGPPAPFMSGETGVRFSSEQSEDLRIFGGRSDRNDSSRFTFNYAFGSEGGEVEGRLLDVKGDTDMPARTRVVLKVLSGPAKVGGSREGF